MALVPGRNYAPGSFLYNPRRQTYDDSPWDGQFHDVYSRDTLTFPHHAYSAAVVHGSTSTEWIETPDTFKFKVLLPGLTANDVKLEIEDGRILCITAEKTEKQQSYTRWNYVENMKSVIRVELPQRAKLDNNKITAHMEKEELTVTIPKKEIKKDNYTRIIPITGPQGTHRF